MRLFHHRHFAAGIFKGVIRHNGRTHPEAIKLAVAASNEERSKSPRPLRAKLAKLQRRYKGLSDELQRFLQLARQPDSGHFGEEALAAAEELAEQKNEVEREMEKVKIDIAYREKMVTDEQLIAKALLAFEKNSNGIPFEEQRDLLRLLVRRIRVGRLDPKKDELPAGPNTWKAQIRTHWYAVNLKLFTTDLIPTNYKNVDLGSQTGEDGARYRVRTGSIYAENQQLAKHDAPPDAPATQRFAGLAEITLAWSDLPDALCAAILAIVRSQRPAPSLTESPPSHAGFRPAKPDKPLSQGEVAGVKEGSPAVFVAGESGRSCSERDGLGHKTVGEDALTPATSPASRRLISPSRMKKGARP